MNFQDLHELLRVELLRRIERGTLTGSRLAQQAGFQQAHISNFLNRKRALSLEGLDRVLAAQNLTIDQILPLDIQAAATRLNATRARPSTRHAHWQRFLAIRADTQQAAAMDPLLAPGAIAVLDGPYNSLPPYRAPPP